VRESPDTLAFAEETTSKLSRLLSLVDIVEGGGATPELFIVVVDC
jgi:hypothetical protein